MSDALLRSGVVLFFSPVLMCGVVLKHSKKPLTELTLKSRLDQNKKVNSNLVKKFHRLYRPTDFIQTE